jgi:hypothetical protein
VNIHASAQTLKPDREHLTDAQRFGELVSVCVMFLILAFFVYHQAANTGFFTVSFGPMEVFFFYGPMLFSLAAPITRAVIGQRNPARALEVVANVFMAAAALWLLTVFPFNFAHFADAFPGEIRFLFAWLNSDIGRIPFILQLIVCPIVALVTAWQFLIHLGREHRDASRLHSVW